MSCTKHPYGSVFGCNECAADDLIKRLDKDSIRGRKEDRYRAPLAGTNPTTMIADDVGGGMADALTRDQEESMREKLDWSGDYDGTTCPNCGRERMLMCANGKRRCEKCNWDPEAGAYSEGPYIG